jgi:hypothetical protein
MTTIYKCLVCWEKTEHNEQYDAFFCKKCDEWKEIGCNDPTCEFCPGRPEKPSMCKDKPSEGEI